MTDIILRTLKSNRTHPGMLRADSWLCALDHPLVVFRGVHTVPEITVGSAECKVGVLPSVISLSGPDCSFLLQCRVKDGKPDIQESGKLEAQ